MSSSKINNPFFVEKRRTAYARKNKLTQLRSTYVKGTPEITNYNSGVMWDEINSTKENLYKSRDPMARDKLRFIASQIKGRDIRVLNIGFGSGNLERICLKTPKNISYWEGVDISKKSVYRVSRMFPKYKFKIGKINNLKNKTENFDYVIASEVLEHISPSIILKSLNEMKRVLKKNGKVIVSVPLNEDLESMIKKGTNYNQHVRTYTPELLIAELKLAGMDVIAKKKLFAFDRFYRIKTLFCNYLLLNFRNSNNLIIVAKKKP